MRTVDKNLWQMIYSQLSGKYGQQMTRQQVCRESALKEKAVREHFPDGWSGNGRGLRMSTVSFAYQLAVQGSGR